MALVSYEPWNLLSQFQNEVNRLFELPLGNLQDVEGSTVVTSHWRPAVDVKEEDNRFVIVADVPGIDPKDIEITMENGVLTLKGERSFEKQEDREGYKRLERARGSFYRRFSLPDSADAEAIKAKGKDGVLEIVIQKHERVQPRRITVQS
ncbi:MAG: Hsp20/alpha crystallin family protein [Gammaproteobacteria bacterium]|nr:Hsp20/alpha crystallin family protein [Gammaproteobacteria bacterium]MCI0591603.1 Hsp20/alpha crystallin family protein [Gammaproteobacteria bacterium]